MLSLFKSGCLIMDEVDLLLHPLKSELNYPIGDAKSLIIHPASTTHNQLTPEQQSAAGAGPEVVRLSIGLETVADLIDDLEQALAKAG